VTWVKDRPKRVKVVALYIALCREIYLTISRHS